MKNTITNCTSLSRSITRRPLALAAVFVLLCAALTLTRQAAKTLITPAPGNGNQIASTAATHIAVPLKNAAKAFDIDQTCSLDCTPTVPSTGQVNTPVSFQATATPTGCASTPPTYEWNFGDGTAVSTQQNPSKTYTAAGTYNWTLTTRASSGATGIDTVAGGYGEGNPARQSPFGVILSIARDPLGRGIFLVDRLNDVSFIRFINTTGASVTLAGKTIAAGANRFLAGGGADLTTENVRGTQVDLGNVSGIGVSPDGNRLYFANSLDAVIRVINIGSAVATVGAGNVDPGNIRTLPVSGISLGNTLSQMTVAANGDILLLDATPENSRVYRITPAGVGTVFAGSGTATTDIAEFSPGAATSIPLLTPRAITINGADTYIADTGHGRVIKVTDGSATLVGQFTIGSGNNRKTFPPFNSFPPFPSGVAWFNGKLYIAMGNSQVIVRMDGSTPVIVAGTQTTACEYSNTNCGDGGPLSSMLFSLNGSSSTAQQPIVGMEADTNGVFLADQGTLGRGRVRFLNFGNSTATVTGVSISGGNGDTVAGNGSSEPYNNNLAKSAGLSAPSGVALDTNGNLFFTERTEGRIRFVNRGNSSVTLFAGTESQQVVEPGRIITVNRDNNGGNTMQEGPVIRTTFDNPQGLFITANGIYVVEGQGGPSVKTNASDPPVTLNKTRTSLVRFINTSSSNVTFYPNASSPITIAPGNIGNIVGGGTSPASTAPEGFALSIVMAAATDVAVAADGTIYIAETGTKRVRKINAATGASSSLTLSGSKAYTGLAFDTAGRLYVTNHDDNQLLRESAAGSGSFSRMDGGGLNRPRDVVVDTEGNAFVVNSQVSSGSPGTNANQIVRVAAAGGAATTFAGAASAGFSGDGGLAIGAQINTSPANPVYTSGSPLLSAPTLVAIVRDPANGQFVFADTVNDRLRVLSQAFATCTRTGTIMIAGNSPAPTLTSIAPTSALAGSGAQTITLTGTGFVPSSVARWNGTDRATTFVSGTQLTVQTLAADITSPGSAQITVFNPAPGGGTSSAQTFTITAPNGVPTITNLSPDTAAEGSPSFTLTVTGTNFVNGSVVRWDGSARTTTFVSATQVTAVIPATDLAGGAGTAQVTVFNPAPGGGTSNGATFTITSTNPVPVLTSLSPSQASAGGTAFTLTVNGSNFAAGSVVRWGGSNRTTTFVSSTQLTAQIPAADIASAGTVNVTVFTSVPGGGVSNALPFTINQAGNPVPTLTSIAPNSAQAGGATFNLTLTGTNFLNNSVVRWNGLDRTTTFNSATQLTAQIPASDIAAVGTAQVTVFNPASGGGGGGSSSAQTFTITAAPNPVPTLTSISPSSVIAGSATFQLTLTGTGFIAASVVRVNGIDRTTSFVSNTSLTAQILASDVANAGSLAITVFNPASAGGGGGISSTQTLTVTNNNPAPTLTSLSPQNVGSGGATFTLTVNGTNFVNGSVVRWNGSDRTTTFVNSTQLTAQIPAADIVTAGQASVTVFTPAPGGGTSSALPVNIVTPNPVPVLSNLSPSTVSAGSGAFTLTISGTGFVAQSVVRYNGVDRQTTFVNTTTLTIQVAANEVTNAGNASIIVFNPPSAGGGGGTSNALTLSIVLNNPVPTLTSLNPTSALVGGAAFVLTVTGTNFVNGSIVRWNGQDRPTTLLSATQLTAQISAADIANAGTATVAVFNPAPGGGTSNTISISILQPNPVPVLTSASPSAAVAGGAGFFLTLNGTGFTPSSLIRWNGADRLTNYVSPTQVTMNITASDIANAGTATITVFNPAPGGGLSNALTYNILSGNPVPTLTSLNPNSVTAGSGNLLLTVNGTNFVNGSVVRWNGIGKSTTFVSSTQLTAQIPATDIALAGTAQITVFNSAPGGGTSNALSLSIVQPNNPVPTLTSLNPTGLPAGGPGFTLTVTGTNFTNLSVVRWNNQNRPTTFVSPVQLTVQIPAGDVANVGTASVVVFNPTPGGGTSNALNFTITPTPNPTPVITTISPNIVGVGGAAFDLTVDGTGFINGSIVRFNSAERQTTFVSATRLIARIQMADIANLGTASITVFTPASGGGGGGISNPLNLTIGSPSPAPTISQISPNLVTMGGTAFTLTVTGTGFTPSSTVRLNGADRLTNYVSPTTLTIQVGANEIATQSIGQVNVFNAMPGGGLSNAALLTVAATTASVSAASYAPNQTIAPESIAAAFGTNLATGIEAAVTVPLPTSLLGTTVRIRDVGGNELLAPLFFVSPTQINYLLPKGLASGAATVTITSGDRLVSKGNIQIERVEPGLFAANANGQGVMTALALRVRANGESVYEELARYNAATASYVPVPLDLGPATDQVFLIVYGTGFRNRNDLANVTAMLGNTTIPVLFASAQGEFVGLDQLNLGPIPRSLVGQGSVNLTLRVEGKTANVVSLTIR